MGALLSRVFVGSLWRADARGPAIVFGLFLMYCCAGLGLSLAYDFQIKPLLYNRVSVVGLFVLFFGFLLRILFTVTVNRPEKPFEFINFKIKYEWQTIHKIAIGIPYLFIITIFFSIYSSIKSAIPLINPFYFDKNAASIDLAIHGTEPWRILHYIFGSVAATWSIGVIYILWLPITCAALAIALFFLDDCKLRDQFIATQLLAWGVLGSLVGTTLSSVGPCYFEYFYGSDQFAELMRQLDAIDQHAPLLSRSTQEYLITAYRTAEPGLGTGISAFPSLHVGTATVVCLFAWGFGPFWKVAGILFVATILVGSVHLGWHYAIDGYASVLAVVLIWRLVGRTLRDGPR